MDNKKINSFSLEELRSRNPSARGILYNGCFIALPEHMTSPKPQTLFDFPCRINAYFILVCTGGSSSVNIDLNEYRISENTILINTPNTILQILGTQHATGFLIGFEERFIQYTNINLRNLLPLFLQLQERPVLQITSQESDLLQHIIKALSHEISDSEGQPFHDEIIRSYVDLFIYKLCSIISKDLKNSPAVESSVKSRNEEYFHKFMHVLANNYKSERSVGFYASQLCITPKYLTTLIKKVSGKSAAEWIDNYVILEAKNLLRYSTMSIQEVAYYLNFSNQSFFGKYFKHQTGMSPSAYKMQNRGGEKFQFQSEQGGAIGKPPPPPESGQPRQLPAERSLAERSRT